MSILRKPDTILARSQAALRGILAAAGVQVEALSDDEILATAEQWVENKADIRVTLRQPIPFGMTDDTVRQLLGRAFNTSDYGKVEIRLEERDAIEIKVFAKDGTTAGFVYLTPIHINYGLSDIPVKTLQTNDAVKLYQEIETIVRRRGNGLTSLVREFLEVPGLALDL